MPESAALELVGLTKTFGAVRAVDEVTLRVERGAFYGLIGPNGAGKTTTLSLAVGLMRPDRGTSVVCGADVWDDPDTAKSRLGVLLDAESLPQRLTGEELLTYVGLLRGLAEPLVRSRVDELLHVLGLQSDATLLVADYSTGMRKKIALAVALLHGPQLLVLDEPFEAVDPVSASTIRSILHGYVRSGGTILFSSHVLVLVEQLCDQVAVMNAGQICAAGTLADVRAGRTLEDAFRELVGPGAGEGQLSWFIS